MAMEEARKASRSIELGDGGDELHTDRKGRCLDLLCMVKGGGLRIYAWVALFLHRGRGFGKSGLVPTQWLGIGTYGSGLTVR